MQIHEGEALNNAAKVSRMGVNGLAEQMGIPRSTLYYNLKKEKLDEEFKEKVASILGIDMEQLFGGIYNNLPADQQANKLTGAELRRKKAFGEGVDEALTFVPVFAQAGYSKHYLDPKFVSELEQVRIPNMPFKGDKYRVFEVSDDSMEPTLKEHFHVVGELVDPEFWDSTAQFYIHVVVTEERIMVKRVYRKDKEWFVLISDNEEFYPQFKLHRAEIKELWQVKRKIDWEMPPPKRFEITV